MKRVPWVVSLALTCLLVFPFAFRAVNWLLRPAAASAFTPEMVTQGRELFFHEWTAGDELAGEGDGLGPVFNAASCIACHGQAAPGGGGGNENNVTVFTVRDRASSELIQQGVVHGFALERRFLETLSLVDPSLPAISRPGLEDLRSNGSLTNANCVGMGSRLPLSSREVNLTQRNTPALFGARLIDAIPDETIIAAERRQRLKWGLATAETEEFPVGRVHRVPDGRVGKFGWKGQIASLSDFVRAACANELGLGNPSHAQPASLANAEYQPPGLDLTDQQCDQITAFVASLPSPVEFSPELPAECERIASGRNLFQLIGCADCHTPDLGEVIGLYSDLLLHRMGRDLVAGGSYGEAPPMTSDGDPNEGPIPSEWRTPPLWGVADSAPYLHDGRATTLKEAINRHGGQAEHSAMEFRQLKMWEQEALIGFLKTLRAPMEVVNQDSVE